MEKTFDLIMDMADLEGYAAAIEGELHNTNLTNEERAFLEARQAYILRHLRVASVMLDANLKSFEINADSRLTSTSKAFLKHMTLEEAVGNDITFKSTTMQKINRAINSNSLRAQY